MKKKSLLIAALSLFILAVFTGEAYTFTNGAPSGRSGGAGENTCATSTCHAGVVNSGSGTMTITTDALGGVYVPGNTYNITVRMAEAGISRFGFQVLSGYSSTNNKSMGTTAIINAGETKLLSSGQRKYVTQVTGGSLGTGLREWTFSWTAPSVPVGDVEFFGAANAANNNGGKTGDQIYTTSVILMAPPVSIDDAAAVPGLEVYPTMVEENVFLHLSNAGIDPLQVLVIDQQGRVLRTQSIQPIGSEVRETVAVGGLAAGVYYLRVAGADLLETGKFVKF